MWFSFESTRVIIKVSSIDKQYFPLQVWYAIKQKNVRVLVEPSSSFWSSEGKKKIEIPSKYRKRIPFLRPAVDIQNRQFSIKLKSIRHGLCENVYVFSTDMYRLQSYKWKILVGRCQRANSIRSPRKSKQFPVHFPNTLSHRENALPRYQKWKFVMASKEKCTLQTRSWNELSDKRDDIAISITYVPSAVKQKKVQKKTNSGLLNVFMMRKSFKIFIPGRYSKKYASEMPR